MATITTYINILSIFRFTFFVHVKNIDQQIRSNILYIISYLTYLDLKCFSVLILIHQDLRFF